MIRGKHAYSSVPFPGHLPESHIGGLRSAGGKHNLRGERAQQGGPDGIHSVLGLAGALPILLGDNIGTTITAVLAAVGQPTDARRTAAAHCCFNLSGSVVCLLALPWMTRLVEAVSPKGPELEVLARQIANAHTLFNLLCTLVWLPLTPVMVRLVCKLVPQPQSSR